MGWQQNQHPVYWQLIPSHLYCFEAESLVVWLPQPLVLTSQEHHQSHLADDIEEKSAPLKELLNLPFPFHLRGSAQLLTGFWKHLELALQFLTPFHLSLLRLLLKFQLLPNLFAPFPTLVLDPPEVVLGFHVQAFLELLAFHVHLVGVPVEWPFSYHTTRSLELITGKSLGS